ncbi:MAG: hypothetical protein QOE11_279 [Solirubrobacteraceae bacterium]|nr:hypothetical protein [Solirubrobacteraceae bacterium]
MTRLRLLLLAIALVAAAVVGGPAPVGPPPALAATCAAYSTQAAAQRAADTRDADGDGIYCESLPCPCLKPGGGASTPTPPPATTAPSPVAQGRSITLGPVRARSGCRVRGPLPDARCTPGAHFSRVTSAQVCRRGYSKTARNVTSATKDAVYASYGMGRHFDGSNGEVDHLVSLELGGSNVRANLFPEAGSPSPGSHEKDRLENRLHSEVCSGSISLRHAQRLVAGDWVAAYRARFG